MSPDDKIKGRLAANLRARYSAMADLREAKDRVKALEDQWRDLADEAHKNHCLAWVDFCYDFHNKGGVTWRTTVQEWESWNPDWQVCQNALRRRKKP